MADNKKPNFTPKFNKSKSITFWLVLLLIIVVFYQSFKLSGGKTKSVTYSDLTNLVETNQIQKAVVNGKEIIFWDKSGKKYSTYLPFEDQELIKEMIKKGTIVLSQKPSKMMSILIAWLPFIVLLFFWFFMMRGMQGSGSKVFSFGKSRAKLFLGGKTHVTFADVAGVEEAKEELEEIVDYLKAPGKFQRLGGRIPRGVLLLGRPGTGKTLLAKAVAGEAKVPFFSISGSDFVEMFVGVGAARVRDLFSEAKKNSPCIVFIDEIDAVGRHRGTGLGGGHDEREQTLNQLLVEMDGFERTDSVIVIAATNRPDVLDPALLRPSRFDRQVIVDLPDIKGREAILRVHVRGLPRGDDVNLEVIARGTPGFSGADLANLVNEAALIAARRDKSAIEMDDFEEAKDKVTMGKARKSKVISEEEKKNTAYHEIGHVLCSIFLEKSEPIHKVTIIPRGFSGGATHFLQTEKSTYSKSYLLQSMVGLMGGRAAEEIVFGEISTGAANDIQRATDIAKKMIGQWGMSSKFGPVTIVKEDTQVFLGKELTHHETISEETLKIFDYEVREIVNNAYNQALEILKQKRKLLDILASQLLEKETLSATQIYEIVTKYATDDELELIKKKYELVKELEINTENSKYNATKDNTQEENKEFEYQVVNEHDEDETDDFDDDDIGV